MTGIEKITDRILADAQAEVDATLHAAELEASNIRAKLCALTICDESGTRLFNEADVQALGEKSAVELSKVFIVAQRLSGITDADVKELSEGLKENPFEDSASA